MTLYYIFFRFSFIIYATVALGGTKSPSKIPTKTPTKKTLPSAKPSTTPSKTPGSIPKIDKNTVWSNLAWGFPDGGKDNIEASTKLIDIDLFDQAKDQTFVTNLKKNGHIVICYFSAGSFEPKRPDSNNALWAQLKLAKMAGWNEYWLDIRNLNALKQLMGARMQLGKAYGCDGFEYDNTDCYDNKKCWSSMTSPKVANGAAIQNAEIAYLSWLADYAHSLGLVAGLKNTIQLIPSLVKSFDFAINEQCHQYSECDSYQPFFDSQKAVLNVEYESKAVTSCSVYNQNLYKTETKWCVSSDNSVCDAKSKWTNCWL